MTVRLKVLQRERLRAEKTKALFEMFNLGGSEIGTQVLGGSSSTAVVDSDIKTQKVKSLFDMFNLKII